MREIPPLPSDDLSRPSKRIDPDHGGEHLAVVGDTYTVLLDGQDTAGRYCLIDMLVPPGGGPPPHRHDFEESFTVLEGEIEFSFRGEATLAAAGETVHIPANAPHSFKNASATVARLLCLCAPAGQEEFFREIGVTVEGRTTPAPELGEAAQAAFREKSEALAPKYRTELLRP